MSNSPSLAPLSGRKDRGRRFTRCACAMNLQMRPILSADQYFNLYFQNCFCGFAGWTFAARPDFKELRLRFGPSRVTHLQSFVKIPSGRLVLFHQCWPWIFTACLSGDNNDCLRPSSCQTSVLRDFACLTQVMLIFGSSVASLRQGICCTHDHHMPFAAARNQREGCTQSQTLLLWLHILWWFNVGIGLCSVR